MFHFLQQLFTRRPSGWHTAALTPAQARRHAAWVAQRVYLNWLGSYFKAYHLHKGGCAGRRGLRAEPLHENGRQGALLFYDPAMGAGNFRHLFEYLGEQLMAQGYRRACADQCRQRHQRQAAVAFKQLFKPAPTDCLRTGLCDQRYGLVMADLVVVDQQPQFIRLASNPLLTPGFTPAAPFEELLQALFDTPAAGPAERAAAAVFAAAF